MIRQALRNMLRYPLYLKAKVEDWTIGSSVKDTVAICAIFREEAPFLGDWIDFHRFAGVSRFYLYNNFSADGYREVLAPYIHEGLVELIDWPVDVGQVSAYQHCIKTRAKEVHWIAFIDIDEFLFAPDGSTIGTVMKRFRNLPAVHVWQAFFGSDGHKHRPQMPVPIAYRHRAPLSQTTVKTIVNPRHIYKIGIHESKFWKGHSLDTAGRMVSKNIQPVLDVLRINHYWSRSLEDLREKVARGDASTAQRRDEKWHFVFEKTLNAEFDESIIPIASRVFGQTKN